MKLHPRLVVQWRPAMVVSAPSHERLSAGLVDAGSAPTRRLDWARPRQRRKRLQLRAHAPAGLDPSRSGQATCGPQTDRHIMASVLKLHGATLVDLPVGPEVTATALLDEVGHVQAVGPSPNFL